MRLIDADELKNLPFERMIHTDFGYTAVPIEEIDNAPTIKSFTLLDIEEQYRKGLEKGLSEWETQRPQGEWLYPYTDNIIGKRRIGRSCRVCSICKQSFTNNIPWDAKFCPNCGAEMRKDV